MDNKIERMRVLNTKNTQAPKSVDQEIPSVSIEQRRRDLQI